MMIRRSLIGSAAGVLLVVVQLASPAAAQVPPTARYVIQPSDTVSITYRYSPEYDFTGPVLPDGYINPPLLGEVRAAGLTLEQLRDNILTKARERLRDPEIVVLLKDFEKPSFSVGGQVDKPGRFELRGRVGVLEGIAMAGGLKPSAKHSQVVLFRRYDEESAITRLINVKELTRAENPARNFDLQTGDFIFVPQNRLSKIERLVPLASIALLNPLLWR